jgi:hypothetical protein
MQLVEGVDILRPWGDGEELRYSHRGGRDLIVPLADYLVHRE